ncbi:pilus assembly protein CpaD [Alteromonas sediminis]|uniref:Pilus assembly protein CpaD n=1 Tax=Alteromonas sediminis TaxID=2259342 RepID=A0A3N5ZAC4_9ALTE|nr:PilN domain-containing protein [Alteromonas sediminis]RPJ66368.1 pilus assembly protein CpaD [Alteromonas sediminis]
MAHINLLPWREKQRQAQKQNYLAVLFMTGALAAALFWMVGQAIDQQIGNQNARNQYLQTEITRLDSLIAEIQKVRDSKDEIEKRMALIEQLQSSRNLAPTMLDELVRVLPPGVSFTTMSRSNNAIEIDGVSDSNNRLSDFMRRLERSEVFDNAELSTIVADTSASDAVSAFNLRVQLSEKALKGAEKEGAGQ